MTFLKWCKHQICCVSGWSEIQAIQMSMSLLNTHTHIELIQRPWRILKTSKWKQKQHISIWLYSLCLSSCFIRQSLSLLIGANWLMHSTAGCSLSILLIRHRMGVLKETGSSFWCAEKPSVFHSWWSVYGVGLIMNVRGGSESAENQLPVGRPLAL